MEKKEMGGEIGHKGVFPNPEGDVSYSPDGKWFVNGYKSGSENKWIIFRMSDGAHVQSEGIYKGSFEGDLRIDPAPRWNRTSDEILLPGIDENEVRQIFLLRVRPKKK